MSFNNNNNPNLKRKRSFHNNYYNNKFDNQEGELISEIIELRNKLREKNQQLKELQIKNAVRSAVSETNQETVNKIRNKSKTLLPALSLIEKQKQSIISNFNKTMNEPIFIQDDPEPIIIEDLDSNTESEMKNFDYNKWNDFVLENISAEDFLNEIDRLVELKHSKKSNLNNVD